MQKCFILIITCIWGGLVLGYGGVVYEDFEESYGGASVYNGLQVSSTSGTLPAPTGYRAPDYQMLQFGVWDSSRWIEWNSVNSPFSNGTFSLSWISNRLTPSTGNQTRLYSGLPSGITAYKDGVFVSFDLWTNDDNPKFGARMGKASNTIFDAGKITGKFSYGTTPICDYDLESWYHIQIYIPCDISEDGKISFHVEKWNGSSGDVVVTNLVLDYQPEPGSTAANFEYAAYYSDALYADGSQIPGGLGITRIDNLSIREISNEEMPVLPSPVLYRNNNNVYTETNYDLDLLNYNYTAPPDQPASPGDVFAPNVNPVTIVPGVPNIGSYTMNSKASRSVILEGNNLSTFSGDDFGKDSKVWVWAQTESNDGILFNPDIIRMSNQNITFTLKKQLSYGAFLIWLENANGISLPVRINTAQAWWLESERAQPGDVISLYGCNLSHDNGTSNSNVYIRPWSSDSSTPSISCAVTAVNPYKVSFVVPASLQIGQEYEVWVHNGHGGNYGWSGPLKLKVPSSNPFVWNGALRNISDYGAIAGDGLDDSSAINAAIQAASDGDVIWIPSGVFDVDDIILVNKAICIEGIEGYSTLKTLSSSYSKDSLIKYTKFPCSLKNLTVVSTATSGMSRGVVEMYGGGIEPMPEGLFCDNCTFVMPPECAYLALMAQAAKYLYFNGCTITGGRGFWIRKASNVFIQNNEFYGKGNSVSSCFLSANAVWNMDVSCNYAASNDRSNNEAVTRFAVFSSNYGNTFNCYIADNETQDCGPLPSTIPQNVGEQMLMETGQSHFIGSPSSIGVTAITFPNVSWTANQFVTDDLPGPDWQFSASIIYIQRGSGRGQWRRIMLNSSDTITIDRPWDVQPDLSSVFVMSEYGGLYVFCNNTLDGIGDDNNNGIPDYIDRDTCLTGIEVFHAAVDSIIDNNTITRTQRGIMINGGCYRIGEPDMAWNGSSNLLIMNNNISSVYRGITFQTSITPDGGTGDDGYGPVILNCIARDNIISDAYDAAIVLDKYWTFYFRDWPWCQSSLFEFNSLNDSYTGSILGKQQGYTIFRNNLFSESEYDSSTVGITVDTCNEDSFLIKNFYDNIGNCYSGVLPGSGQLVNKHHLNFTVDSGSCSGPQYVLMHNVGTSQFVPACSSSQTWLLADIPSDPIASESYSILRIEINPAGLSTGMYEGEVTLTGAAQYSPQKIAVTLKIY